MLSSVRAVAFCGQDIHLMGIKGTEQLCMIRISNHFRRDLMLIQVLVQHADHGAVQHPDPASVQRRRFCSDADISIMLHKIIGTPVSNDQEDEVISGHGKEFTNIAAYLMYRYEGAGRFAAETIWLLADLVYQGLDIQDAARMFSGEVEYSDINIDEALETDGMRKYARHSPHKLSGGQKIW